MFGAIAGGIASALAGGAMCKLFGGGQKAASGGIQGDVLATDNNTVGMGDAGIKSAIQGSNVPNPDEAVPRFVSGAMAKAGKGLVEGTLQAGTSAVSDKLIDLVGLGGKSAADKGKDTRDYLAAAFPELNAWERAGADASSAGMVDAGFENQKELTKMQLDNQKEIAEMQNETQKEIAGIQSATSRQNTKDRYMHKMRYLLINRRSLLLALRLLWKTPIFPSNSRFPRLCAKCLLKLKRLVSILPMTKSKK